ncbi:S-layer homology domain-containing protein [Sedimentibacter sp. MB31-C6]|uniref:S-layer homology domain-containing protein n=1 Tax=Sedimentibacter sp. MB31-C6 TaxID=3109366 RepID=UPI002DDD505C|nr:S-layer homology domain-containing protein [Sedimentibacter sp. MB36-C1]WSI05553.1 S-layer homology domain-containing protein [Sedimentibacter sp. MB36-C1]
MKILKTTTQKILIFSIIFVFVLNSLAFANNYNPSREEIEIMIDEVATKRAIPSVLLKAIARVESVYEHYNADGSPKISGTSIGLMQINNRYGGYDSERLKYDIKYNIEAGADVLLNKWSMSSYKSVSSVGNMDPNVLENWYFALWAYNGWAQSNNPHMLSSYAKKYTYQQLIYDVCEDEYNQTINNIDFSYLPQSGKPSRSLVVPTPYSANSGHIILYEEGDYVRTDGVRNSYQLRDVPGGKYIHDLQLNQLGVVLEGPVLENGYYWYKVKIDDNKEGWIERNWLLRTGDIEHGRYIFDDIAFHWARKDIMELYNKGIVSEALSFNPDEIVTKEEFCIFLSKTLNLSKDKEEKAELEEIENEINLPFDDIEKINPWALNYIYDIYDTGLVKVSSGNFNPQEKLTRMDAALILSNIFEEDSKYETLDINKVFSDLTTLSQEEVDSIKKAYTSGLMTGKNTGEFQANEYLSRAETAAVMTKILNKLENN